MDQGLIKITDVISNEYKDFLSYCATSEKIFISDLNNVDLVAFRTYSGQTREYVKNIKMILENPVLLKKESEEKEKDEDAISAESNQELIDVSTSLESESIHSNIFMNSVNDVSLNDSITALCTDFPLSEECGVELLESKDDEQQKLINATPSTKEPYQKEMTVSDEPTEKDFLGFDNDDSLLANLFNINISSFSNIRIDELNLSNRASNRLKCNKIKTVADILSKTVGEIKNIHNMGTKTFCEIMQNLQNYTSISSNSNQVQLKALVQVDDKHNNTIFDHEFNNAVKSLLYNDEHSINNLTKEQCDHFAKLENAIETVGRELCLETYLNPNYVIQICNTLWDFSFPYIQRLKAMEEAFEKVNLLTDFIKDRKAIPFIHAYSAKESKKLTHLISFCHNNTTILHMPYIYEKLEQEENTVTEELNKFLDWLAFDPDTLITSISEKIHNFLNEQSRQRYLEIFANRMEGKTLEEIGSHYEVTRERIRQIERKMFNNFWCAYKKQKYDLIMMIYALKDGDTVIFFDELQKFTSENFASLLWVCIKHNQEHDLFYYSNTLDAIVVKNDNETHANENTLLATIGCLITPLPGIIDVSQKDTILADIAEKNNIPLKMLHSAFHHIYQRSKGCFYKVQLTVATICEYVLKHRFPAGFKIGDEFEADRFREYIVEFFGEKRSSITNRALDAKIGEVGVLCGRGKYIHPDFMQVDQSIIDAINDYVEFSPRSLLPYGEIYEAMRDTFEGTQITNRYLLQGALKKYGCRFNTSRDFIRKTQMITFVDELEAFVEERGIVHKTEIFAEFTSIGDAGLGQIVARSTNVFNIDNGNYIHASQFDIQPKDYEQLRNYLKSACQDIPVNIRSVHESVALQFTDFMYRNDFEDRNKLFAALNYMFRDEFIFSRPYIAKLGVNDVSNRSVILQHIEEYDSIEIEELIDICEENSINYISASYLFQMLAPEYIRINKSTLIKKEYTGITDEIVAKVVEIVSDMLETNDYIVGSKINDFLWFPQIDVNWNEFLVENLIIQSKKINIVYMISDPLKHPNSIYVSDKYQNDTFNSLLIKILTCEVHKGTFTSKVEMREWLKEEGFIESKLPNILESTKYFYVNETGVHCTEE